MLAAHAGRVQRRMRWTWARQGACMGAAHPVQLPAVHEALLSPCAALPPTAPTPRPAPFAQRQFPQSGHQAIH